MTETLYLRPTSLDQAIADLGDHGEEGKLIAGGVALVNLMNLKLLTPRVLIDISRIPGLDQIRQDADGTIRLGALVTHAALEESPMIRTAVPLLAAMAREIGCGRIRNRGTLGGNLCHADPQEDPPAALIALGAGLRIMGPQGERLVAADRFFVGTYETALHTDEILVEILVPRAGPGTGWSFLKFGPRRAMDYTSTISIAVSLRLQGGTITTVGIGMAGVAATPLRAGRAESCLRGQAPAEALLQEASRVAAAETDPVSDLQYSAEYKRAMVPILVRRALRQALVNAGERGADGR